MKILELFSGWKGTAASAIAALILGWVAAWQMQSWRYDARIARIERDHQTTLAAHAEAAAHAQATARAEELRRITAIEEIKNEAENRMAVAVADERRAADVRLHDELAALSARYRRAANDPAAASNCAAARTAAGVLADLLAESDDLAAIYAATADRNRIAGLTCEAAYDAVR